MVFLLRALFFCWLASSLVGCGCGGAADDDDIQIPDAGDGDTDTDSDTDTDTNTGTGTGTETDTDTITDGPPATELVMDSVLYGDDDEGFDLDDHTTVDVDDPIGCGHIDGPDGIDNQLGPVMQDIDRLLEINSEGLLASSIEEGILLMLYRLVGLDDRVDDDSVDVHVFNAVDADDPENPDNNLGGEGEFYIDRESVIDDDEEQPIVAFLDGSLVGGVFEGGPEDFFVSLPLGVDMLVPITLVDARLRFRLRHAVFVEGIVGGAVPVEEIVEAVRNDPKYGEQAGFIEIALYNQADMDLVPEGLTEAPCADRSDCARGQTCDEDGFCIEPAGRCDALSGAVRITAIRARILGVEPPEE